MISKFFRKQSNADRLKTVFDNLTTDFIAIGFAGSNSMKWKFKQNQKNVEIDATLKNEVAKEFWFQQPWLDQSAVTPTQWWNNDWGKVGKGFLGFITTYSKFKITKLTSLQKLNILTKVNMDNNKMITA